MDGKVWAGAPAVGAGMAERAAGEREHLAGEPDRYRRSTGTPAADRDALAEGQGRMESNALLRAAAPPGDTPLVVLASVQSIDHLPFWKEAQETMAWLSSNSRLVVASSGHAVHFEQPALVVENIRQIVDAARTGQPLQP